MKELPPGCWGGKCKGPVSAKQVPEGEDALLEHCPDCVGGDVLLAATLMGAFLETRGFPPLGETITALKRYAERERQTAKDAVQDDYPEGEAPA